ncbi:hypothetical protein I6N96_08000 [Enterococcus sp. BWM-S5]|uniref:Uncharacterized protein n=1 Tax=Enterococcus larvae TaxID=2794352 RepID=A0ABS4CKA4_9ENTE|nr:hypothetical protein [Enterococcus larvae]MBP1046224.1 hypothetical protein [Enterococcus larvae]
MYHVYLASIEEETFEKICCSENLYLNLAHVENENFSKIAPDDLLFFENSEYVFFKVVAVIQFEELRLESSATVFSINFDPTLSADPVEDWQLLKVKAICKKMSVPWMEILRTTLKEYITTITDGYIPTRPAGSPERIEADEMVTKIYETWGAVERSAFVKEIVPIKNEE